MTTSAPREPGGIVAVVVTHESAAVIDSCLVALGAAAPERGLDVRVVDNGSTDDSADRAASRIGTTHVLRRAENRGFAAGVNAALQDLNCLYLAVVNPDVILPPGALDRLAAILDAHPRAGLIGPRVRDTAGRIDRSVGHFPTLTRERAHAMLLDQLLGHEGRRMTFPLAVSTVDWISGCMWLVRVEALRAVGPLDEDYFMYFEDVDYCKRLVAAGWDVLATPDVEVTHAIAKGSSRSATLPADGGEGPALHYFRKFQPQVAENEVRRALALGWGLRRAIHTALGLLGNPSARIRARRFALALQTLARR